MQHQGGISLTLPIFTHFLPLFIAEFLWLFIPGGLLIVQILFVSMTEPRKYSVINLFPEENLVHSLVIWFDELVSTSSAWQCLLRNSLSARIIFFLGPNASIPMFRRSCNSSVSQDHQITSMTRCRTIYRSQLLINCLVTDLRSTDFFNINMAHDQNYGE